MLRSLTALTCLTLARAYGCNNCPGFQAPGLDASLGCEENLDSSLLLCFIGGALVCLLPCCCLSLRAQRRWSQAFLEPGNPSVLRIQATVQEKLQKTTTSSQGEETTTYSLKLQFKANKVSLLACHAVCFEFWEEVEQGAEVEVACREEEPRDFVVVEDERLQHGDDDRLIGCVLGLLFAAGAGICGAGVALTGCPVGLVALALPLLAGLVCGQFLCVPMMRRMVRLDVEVEGS